MNKKLQVRFWCNANGKEPVRDWLKSLLKEEKKDIGDDLKTVELGWPIGMPTCSHLREGIWEVRTNLSSNKIARVLFYTTNKYLVLVHGFIKKTQKTPNEDIDLALKRKKASEAITKVKAKAKKVLKKKKKKKK